MSVELAYLAGLFDGEGSVGFYGNGKYVAFTVEIKMTELEVIQLFAERFGGKVWERKPDREGYKTQYRWRMRGERARNAYFALEPYLRVKKLR